MVGILCLGSRNTEMIKMAPSCQEAGKNRMLWGKRSRTCCAFNFSPLPNPPPTPCLTPPRIPLLNTFSWCHCTNPYLHSLVTEPHNPSALLPSLTPPDALFWLLWLFIDLTWNLWLQSVLNPVPGLDRGFFTLDTPVGTMHTASSTPSSSSYPRRLQLPCGLPITGDDSWALEGPFESCGNVWGASGDQRISEQEFFRRRKTGWPGGTFSQESNPEVL